MVTIMIEITNKVVEILRGLLITRIEESPENFLNITLKDKKGSCYSFSVTRDFKLSGEPPDDRRERIERLLEEMKPQEQAPTTNVQTPSSRGTLISF